MAADGSVLPPFIVFKGAAVQARWTSPRAYPGTVYSVSTNGWMEEPQFFNWFESVFVRWVKDKRVETNLPEQQALLLYDGHKSHISLRIIESALQNKITLVKFPSHLTDRLKPLDKCIFGPVKTAWEKKLIAHGKKHMGHGVGRLKRNEFTELLGEVWREAITVVNIKSAFLTTGTFPVDSKKFPEDEFNPGELRKFKANQLRAVENAEIELTTNINSTEETETPTLTEMQPSTSSTPAILNDGITPPVTDIVSVFSLAITKALNVDLNKNSTEPKKIIPRLKQAQYGEVLTTAEVVERLKEAERLKDEKNNRKGKPRGKKTPTEKLKRKRIAESDIEEEELNEKELQKLCNDDSDDNINEEEWAEEVAEENCQEVEYTIPDWQLIQPGKYLLVVFLGGSRKCTQYKYVCRVRQVDEESGDIEVVGLRRNDRFSTEFVEKERDISEIEFKMIQAILPEPNIVIKSRKTIYVFPGSVSVFEQ